MEEKLSQYLINYLGTMTKDHAEQFIEIGLARIAYVSWATDNGFFKSEGEHLDPYLGHFPEMKKAFRELANENPLLCAFLLLGRENDYQFCKKQAEEFEKQEKKEKRGRKKTIK